MLYVINFCVFGDSVFGCFVSKKWGYIYCLGIIFNLIGLFENNRCICIINLYDMCLIFVCDFIMKSICK